MKLGVIITCIVIATLPLWAQQSTPAPPPPKPAPSAINFNLVQVNNYAGQEQLTDQVTTPGQRVVIDPNNPNAVGAFGHSMAPKTVTAVLAPDYHVSVTSDICSLALPWESSAVMFSPTGKDSILVRASRTGCPGTEVRPSVSVAFPTGKGWSDPPIRFGPLSENTICALGRGQKLEVSVVGNSPPKVRLLMSSR